MAAGLSGEVTVYRDEDRIRWSTVNENAIKVAFQPSRPERATLFGYEEGSQMPGLPAPARRAALFLGDETVARDVITADGLALFDATVLWATDRAAEEPAAPEQGAADLPEAA